MKALVNTPKFSRVLAFRDLPEPEPRDSELVVSVRASSLNRGELALMRTRPEGWRPGQDVAGTVARAARNGAGPKVGDRVVALVDGAGWAERVAVPLERVAPVPDEVTLERAAALPMVGLTALGLLRRCAPLLGHDLAVTGASGGVGSVLVQLGRLAGARVTAIARAEHQTWLTSLGVSRVIATLADADDRFDYVLESVGGSSLEGAIAHVRPNGRIICFGNSSASKAAFDMFSFFGAENACVDTFFSYKAFDHSRIGKDLEFLLNLVASGRLEVRTNVHDWCDVQGAVEALERRGTSGKIVLLTASQASS